MRLVVDSNVLFTFFWKNSILQHILKQPIELFAPEYALEEINKYTKELMEKTSLLKEEFKKTRQKLALTVDFIPLEEYSSSFHNVTSLSRTLTIQNYHEIIKDIDFLALSIHLQCPLWSNDRLLKKQSTVTVLTTKEIIELLDLK